MVNYVDGDASLIFQLRLPCQIAQLPTAPRADVRSATFERRLLIFTMELEAGKYFLKTHLISEIIAVVDLNFLE